MLLSKSRAWAEIDLGRIAHNVEEVRKLIPKQSKIMGIVKANAYGHGDVECARALQACGVDFFGVSSVDEAMHLRMNGIDSKILILGYTPPEHFSQLVKYDLIQTLVDLPYAKKLDAYAQANDCVIQAHAKADTGMNRIGVVVQDETYHIEELFAMYAMKHVHVCGIFSHFSVSDSQDEDDLRYTRHQIELFARVLADLRAAGVDPGTTHLQNSYGILNYPDLCYDYVRPGLLYMGVTSDDAIKINTDPHFLPILSLKANVTMVKWLHEGDSVSYGRHFRAKRKTKVATVSIGYADGVPRELSNQDFEVLLHGRRVKIIGNICMDQMMLDVTEEDDVKEGDIVTLIGEDGGAIASVDAMSRASHTINNETLTRFSVRLPRIYKKQG